MAAPGAAGDGVLKDVVAYVEVWSSSGTENYSKVFTTQLVDMGAKVSKTFNKQVTHVVFKDGYQSTWDKAQERGAKLVSVLWVEKCRTAGARVDEALFPALNPREQLPPLLRKKRKCMQPKDLIPKTRENDRRLQRKFEKMTKELQRQKMTAGVDTPVLLFQSLGSMKYSPPATSSRQNSVEKSVQQAEEQGQGLSRASSPMSGKTQKNPGTSFPEAAGTMSRDPLHSGERGASSLCSSLRGVCGTVGCGPQEESRGGSASDACTSSSGAMVGSGRSSPPSQEQSHPRESVSRLAQEERTFQRDLPVQPASLKRAQAVSVSDKMAEKLSLSPALSTEGYLLVHSRPRSSTKRERTEVDLHSTPKGKQRRQSCSRRLAMLSPLRAPPASTSPEPECLRASYEDYFSPDNRQERECRPSSHRSPLSTPTLSKRERRSLLQMSDFSCMGEKSSPVHTSSSTANTGSHFHRPAIGKRNPASTWVALEEPPAVAESPGPGGQARPPQGGGSEQDGRLPCPAVPSGSLRPRHSTSEEPRQLLSTKSTQNEGGPCEGPEAQGDYIRGFGEDGSPEVSTEDKENVSTGCSENVKNGPVRCDFPDNPCPGFHDCVRPEEPKKSGRGAKPTRTLVMTSMPSEKQDVVIQVVKNLGGFSLSPEVCETTTHVLAGSPVRTLNVLLGLARGCWVLSYEWALWSLELGHWISEEPFELSTHFPAATVCRRERQLCPGQYRGTLFADQPPMFITPASSPPRAKLCELVRLCGGQVSPVSRRASIVIGPHSTEKKATSKYLSEKWVLDSITQHKVCDLESYLLLQ